jgi:hypothetical protein
MLKSDRIRRLKPTPILVAAAGFAMLAACTVENADNAAGNADANAAAPASEAAAPAADDAAAADTLGNQLNQLQESDAEASNSSD